jgi:hypothetical protein
MPALHDWQNFYLLTGTAAATLIGLLFVAFSISVGANITARKATDAIDTFVTPILLSYAQVFFISCLGVIPFQSFLIPGALLLAQGSANTLLAIRVAWRILALHREDMDRGHWVWHFLLPFLAGILLVSTALGVLTGEPLATAGLAVADLLCLAIGLRNSWMLTIWLVLYRTQGNDASPEKQTRGMDFTGQPSGPKET